MNKIYVDMSTIPVYYGCVENVKLNKCGMIKEFVLWLANKVMAKKYVSDHFVKELKFVPYAWFAESQARATNLEQEVKALTAEVNAMSVQATETKSKPKRHYKNKKKENAGE